MNPTFLYVVWSAITIATVTCAAFLIHALIRFRPIVDRLENAAAFLEANRPRIDQIVDDVGAEIVELRRMSEKANRIVGSAESVTRGLQVAVQPIITEVSDLGQSVRHVRAAAVAVQAGLSAWWDHRRVNVTVPSEGNGHNQER
jgi:uncharacterized protein YoxC